MSRFKQHGSILVPDPDYVPLEEPSDFELAVASACLEVYGGPAVAHANVDKAKKLILALEKRGLEIRKIY